MHMHTISRKRFLKHNSYAGLSLCLCTDFLHLALGLRSIEIKWIELILLFTAMILIHIKTKSNQIMEVSVTCVWSVPTKPQECTSLGDEELAMLTLASAACTRAVQRKMWPFCNHGNMAVFHLWPICTILFFEVGKVQVDDWVKESTVTHLCTA